MKCNLVRRQVLTDHHCDRCTTTQEDMLRALWPCSELDGVWDIAEWDFKSWVDIQNFRELLNWIFDHGKRAEIFSLTAWCIWQQPNKVRNQQPPYPIDMLSHVAAKWLIDFIAAQPTTPIRTAQSSRLQWKTPPPSSFKVNYDGTVCSSSNCSGIGVVIRDHDGLVIASLAQNLSQAYKSVEIEAMVATRAIEFLAEVGVDRVVIEGDLSVVTEALRSNNAGLASYGLLIEDAKLLERNFSELSYSHMKREGNKVAHGLTILALY